MKAPAPRRMRPAFCATCGATLVMRPATHEDAYRWVDTNGAVLCPATAPPPELSDSEWWDSLRTGSVADVAFYSVLQCALTLCWHPWNRQHRIVGGEFLSEPPWCCGEPMRWAPSGWRCRERCDEALVSALPCTNVSYMNTTKKEAAR